MRGLGLVVCLLLLASCGRPRTSGERYFAATLQGETFDPRPVRIVGTDLIGNRIRSGPARPQIACRERIWPPPEAETVRISTAAIMLFEVGVFREDLYFADYLDGYPEVLRLPQAMLFAHEMTHVWQWQNRARTGYHPLRAASEHKPGGDPYLFDLSRVRAFLDYSDEQQGALVEEFVCCRALDPGGARTQRLYDILTEVFPKIERHSRAQSVWVPWKDAPISGICSD